MTRVGAKYFILTEDLNDPIQMDNQKPLGGARQFFNDLEDRILNPTDPNKPIELMARGSFQEMCTSIVTGYEASRGIIQRIVDFVLNFFGYTTTLDELNQQATRIVNEVSLPSIFQRLQEDIFRTYPNLKNQINYDIDLSCRADGCIQAAIALQQQLAIDDELGLRKMDCFFLSCIRDAYEKDEMSLTLEYASYLKIYIDAPLTLQCVQEIAEEVLKEPSLFTTEIITRLFWIGALELMVEKDPAKDRILEKLGEAVSHSSEENQKIFGSLTLQGFKVCLDQEHYKAAAEVLLQIANCYGNPSPELNERADNLYLEIVNSHKDIVPTIIPYLSENFRRAQQEMGWLK